ncbi:piggyBac transposable element-derived protein 4-like [Saccostrea cucullata]|uniref:piggyBac transposable element-derived protein 4-like n=1 Tax=Saccostrea cuccullata TaxID=36930 RepID=UPI002ED3FAB8
MAESEEGLREGSDSEGDYDEQKENIADIEREIIRGDVDDWILNIFQEDSDDEAKFLGFQSEWTFENFHQRLGNVFRKIGGATVEHPEEVSAGQYFELFWTNKLLDRLPDKGDYWMKNKWMFVINFNRVMSKDRFFLIWRYLHVQNNEIQPDTPDNLWKICYLWEFLNKKFGEMYVPYGNATVDESMIKFRGRFSFQQYLPPKPVIWGVK